MKQAGGSENMTDEQKKLLAENGWTVECESPLEIRHEDGSFATSNAAEMVFLWLLECDEECGTEQMVLVAFKCNRKKGHSGNHFCNDVEHSWS